MLFRMSLLRPMLIRSFVLTAAVWTVAAFPLFRHFFTGIPSSAHNIERGNARAMILGDHLQFFYFHWLFSDMLAGKTPLFENRYEFNTGDDRERYHPGPYNLPFSLIFAAARPLFGRAGAWNITLFVTLWLTHAFTWLWLRRFLKPDWLAALVAICSFAFPFRWVMLFGGSPTGMAMMWPSLLTLGLLMALLEERPLGGGLAALALIGAYFNDRHVFLFSFLALPFLGLFAMLLRRDFPWRSPAFWCRLTLALLPLAAAVGALGWLAWRSATAGFEGTSLASGRALTEILWYTPRSRGLSQWGGKGRDAHIYLGYILYATLGLHLVALVARWRHASPQERRRSIAGLWLWLTGILVVLLALGPRGPWDGALFTWFRDHVPGFRMIRQSAKIFALLTILLPGALALALADLRALFVRRPALATATTLLPLLLVAEHLAQIRVTVCLLDEKQEAYAAVAEEASRRGEVPRAVILPLWPGDADWSARYQYYVSLYRIRMLNGYRPVVPLTYKALTTYFAPLNLGLLREDLLDDLLARGFRYLIFHEDAYPEKIGSFPSVFLRDRLLEHPRLRFLRQDQSVWSFQILEHPSVPPPPRRPFRPLFPARVWEAEYLPFSPEAKPETDPDASLGLFLRMPEGAIVTGRFFRCDHAPAPHLALRLRGQGELELHPTPDAADVVTLAVDSPEWTWRTISLPASSNVTPRLTARRGEVGLDIMAFWGFAWQPPTGDEEVVFPADSFFRAGYSIAETGAVHLRERYEPDDVIFYGPRLPFHPGRYELRFAFDSPASPGTKLGYLQADAGGTPLWTSPVEVIQGKPAALCFELNSNRPLTLYFRYSRRADMTIRSVTLRRRDDGPTP